MFEISERTAYDVRNGFFLNKEENSTEFKLPHGYFDIDTNTLLTNVPTSLIIKKNQVCL